jgi:hypothetical protein
MLSLVSKTEGILLQTGEPKRLNAGHVCRSLPFFVRCLKRPVSKPKAALRLSTCGSFVSFDNRFNYRRMDVSVLCVRFDWNQRACPLGSCSSERVFQGCECQLGVMHDCIRSAAVCVELECESSNIIILVSCWHFIWRHGSFFCI